MTAILNSLKNWLNPKPSTTPQPHIIFLDGDCSFCQNSAQFLAKLDAKQVLNFTTLQGETAKLRLPESWRNLTDAQGHPTGAAALIENPGAPNQKQLQGPNAILRTLYLIGGPPALAYPLIGIPAFIKNPIYNFIAKHRHQLPFTKKSCPIPTPELKKRHLP